MNWTYNLARIMLFFSAAAANTLDHLSYETLALCLRFTRVGRVKDQDDAN
jgi:hypothetical protein